MSAYYNEHDHHAAQWLRNLIEAKLIAPGEVDERSIEDVKPDELVGFTQCHFFAGIGGWSLALRLAGWPDDRPVWTGSCPCQSFSAAGKGRGLTDERHLWPAWFHLIRICRPPVIFGEQVDNAIRHGWFDLVQADLEGAGYAVGNSDICAAGVGAPHIRQRLWFVADAGCDKHWGRGGLRHPDGKDEGQAYLDEGEGTEWQREVDDAADGRSVCRVGHPVEPGLEGYPGNGHETEGRAKQDRPAAEAGGTGGLAAPKRHRPYEARGHETEQGGNGSENGVPVGSGDELCEPAGPGPVNGFWRDADWLFCRDGKWRPVEPGLECLVDGLPFKLADGRTRDDVLRRELIKGFGNAIVPPLAAEFIAAYMEWCNAKRGSGDVS